MSARTWKVSEAKAHLSEMLQEAQGGPQIIESRGRDVAAVIGIDEYRKLEALRSQAAPEERLSEFLRFNDKLRRGGGARIELPKRKPRRSPFAGKGDY
jgi:prevent-host-death family protein